jgi:hypothetical protein
MENNSISNSNMTLCYVIVKVITQQYFKLLSITSQVFSGSYGFNCPIALYNDHIIASIMCYLGSLNHGLPNNIE